MAVTPLLALSVLLPACWRLAVVARALYRHRALPRVDEAPDPEGAPLVSVLVPARNEERRLPACLASLRAQSYAPLEILVIDDASEDRTAAIVKGAAREDPRVRYLRVEGPPPGWTGKSFALARGAEQARGAWLLFTDADTVHAPGSVARALGFAQAGRLDLLSLVSRQLVEGFWERVIQPVVFGLLDRWYPLHAVNDPASPAAAANGIFILVRREAYERVGGHRRTGREILEDVALARAIKGWRRRIAFADGTALVAARMYSSLGELRRGWTKNLYALRERRPAKVALAALDLVLVGVWPPAALLALAVAGGPGPALGAAALATGLIVGAEVPFRSRRGYDPAWAPTYPVGAACVLAFLLESAVRDWLGLGVSWKARVYVREAP